ncbi:MAG: hypothetical protein GKR93_01480 [Gammaproteobacteria bacterium]|nr:hypothetical protein [Gammaproteobacteria bacterium]
MLMKNKSIKSYTYLYLFGFSLVLSGILSLSFPVLAQQTEDYEVWDQISETMGLITEMDYQLEDKDEKKLLIRLGVIGGIAPEYRGADEYRFSYAPNIHIVWNDWLYLKGRKLGVELFDKGGFYGGAFVRYNGGRSENNDGLEGLGDISRTFTSGAYLNYRYQGLRLKSEVRHDFLNEGHGTLAIFRLGSRLPWNDPLFYLGVETTWASREHMRTFFGVNNLQGLASGLTRYQPDAGMRDVSVNLSSAYKFSQHWSVAAQLRYQYLLGDAADSPIVRASGSRHGLVAGMGLSYEF